MRMWRKNKFLRYCSPTPKFLIFGAVFLLLAVASEFIEKSLTKIVQLWNISIIVDLSSLTFSFSFMSVSLIVLAILEFVTRSDKRNIKYIVRKRLCASYMGNPLHLVEGEIEPFVKVKKTDRGFQIKVECRSAKFEDVTSLESVISDCLRNKFGSYAVTAKEEDIAGRYTDYYIEDVVLSYNKQSIFSSINDVPTHLTKIFIREDVFIDYARVLNSSAIVAGRSRSGKTTAIISTFLLPMLKQGRDDFGSTIIIVDPKSAELSLCPHVLSPSPDGSVEHILEAVRQFNLLRIERQKIINDYCKNNGKAVKWFDVGMKQSVLFLDEFVSIQDMFPKKPSKEKPDYSLAEFQGLLRQIATQGASAGCFLILSTAEASVGTGGLESAVNNACGIRILFKPSLDEARYLWSKEALAVMRERRYLPGDAWFSADDGVNNSVRFVKFPRLELGEYEVLSELLNKYYDNSNVNSAMSGAKERCVVSD